MTNSPGREYVMTIYDWQNSGALFSDGVRKQTCLRNFVDKYPEFRNCAEKINKFVDTFLLTMSGGGL